MVGNRHGYAVVVSPLLSLAKDQRASAVDLGIEAEAWNSSIEPALKRRIAGDLQDAQTTLRLLFTTPESLETPDLGDALRAGAASGLVKLFCVDEAHCVSQWGNSFRPSYLRLGEARAQLMPGVPILAMTGTATAAVRRDMARSLELRSPVVVDRPASRPELCYDVVFREALEHERKATARASDADEEEADPTLQDLAAFIEAQGTKSGIVYCVRRETVDAVARELRGLGADAAAYHAGLGSSDRARVQDQWKRGDVQVVVATVAFGMGIDKSDVRWVVHHDVPISMEGFLQESGRAGRDGLPAISRMYASHESLEQSVKLERKSRRWGEEGTDEEATGSMVGYVSGEGCKRLSIARYLGEQGRRCAEVENSEPCISCRDRQQHAANVRRWQSYRSASGGTGGVVGVAWRGVGEPAAKRKRPPALGVVLGASSLWCKGNAFAVAPHGPTGPSQVPALKTITNGNKRRAFVPPRRIGE